METPTPNNNEKNLAMFAHLGGIVFGFLPSLIIWLIKKDESKFVEDQAKEALNFQILVAIAFLVSSVLMVIGIGCLLYPIVWVVDIVYCIIAAIKVSNGELYRYPFTLRLVK